MLKSALRSRIPTVEYFSLHMATGYHTLEFGHHPENNRCISTRRRYSNIALSFGTEILLALVFDFAARSSTI